MLVRVARASRLRSIHRQFCSGGKDDWWGDSAEPGKVFDDIEETPAADAKKKVPEIVRRDTPGFTAAPVRRTPVVEGTPKLSLSEALFLAKEAGVFTTREVQTHIIKSPSFSRNDSPFVLENWFKSEDETGVDPFSADLNKPKSAIAAGKETSSSDAPVDEKKEISETDIVPEKIHQFLTFLSDENAKYFVARNREWKAVSEGKGTRKRATAHVVITRGTGIVKVNGEEDFYKRFPLLSNRFDVLFPMEACGAAGLFDVYIGVKGGGISGQAGAARLALGRALVNASAQCEEDLTETLVLYEDTRQRTSKFAGKKGAYARHNWTLR
jgi:ribosomal protein S9